MNSENNLLLQSAQLRAGNYNGTLNQEQGVFSDENVKKNQYESPEDSYCSKYCTTTNIIMTVGTLIILLVIAILLISYK